VFGAANYVIRKTKELANSKRMLSAPNPKPGQVQKDDTTKLVHEFYDDDGITRCVTSKTNFVSVKELGKTKQQLFLCNLNEALVSECKHFGFSRFSDIRPRNIVTAGACGTP
jgi:hypothetical protein